MLRPSSRPRTPLKKRLAPARAAALTSSSEFLRLSRATIFDLLHRSQPCFCVPHTCRRPFVRGTICCGMSCMPPRVPTTPQRPSPPQVSTPPLHRPPRGDASGPRTCIGWGGLGRFELAPPCFPQHSTVGTPRGEQPREIAPFERTSRWRHVSKLRQAGMAASDHA